MAVRFEGLSRAGFGLGFALIFGQIIAYLLSVVKDGLGITRGMKLLTG